MRLFAGNGPLPANCYYMGNEMGYALVADCDRKAGAAAAETLESAGWHVAFMESGRGAIEAVQSSQSEMSRLSASAAEKRRESARQCVASLGVPEHLKGFEYLSDAVALCSADDRLLERATSMLYPKIARLRGATAGGVEHAIRQAVETTWTRGNMDTLLRLFGNSIDPQRGKPTNIECIARLAEAVCEA